MKAKSEREVAQSGPTLSNPMDCSLPGSYIHGIFQARVLEWGAIAFRTHQDHLLIPGQQQALTHQDHLLIPGQQWALTTPHTEHLHSKGQNPPRTQGNLCPLESESSALAVPQRAEGLPKALGEVVLTAQWKASMQTLPSGAEPDWS